MKKIIKSISFTLLFFIVSGFMQSDSDIYFQMSKGIDIFGRVYKEVAINYVDEVKPQPFMLEGIKGMLSNLDPYTVYIDENHQKDIELITMGKYGGIGATVGLYNDKITIVDLIEGYSAQRQGIRIGDVIKKVDSIEVSKENYDDLGKYLKREPGTEISITIDREGQKSNIVFNLVSEEIEIKNLTYFGFIPEESNNVYLKLSSFSRSAGDEIRKAIQELKIQKEIKSIVLDLRGNPGGLLDAAIDVSEKFLAKESLIVSIKGRDIKNIQEFNAKEEPIAGKIKLAILVDEGSASASEIVAGALQDHDRGVILGEKSFGKGLVQTVIPLSFNTSLKMTTARYYTPSGRCIQEIDYSQNKELFGDNVTNDEKVYLTDNKRKVFASGGIAPDSVIKNSSESHLVRSLLAKGMFFKFATNFYNTSTEEKVKSSQNEDLFNLFMDYLKSQDFTYQTESELLIHELEETVKKEGYNSNLLEDIEKLNSKFLTIKEAELSKYKSDIIAEINKEISARIDGRKGRIIESLKYDEQFETALTILADTKVYNDLLNSKN
ncbi:MAG: S41 family peptidase [Ignavibacteriae bacterium]|nr:S41 family peptidase [Ignavibacteriota bacterium]MCB9259332.1 S41 family peptidase [Ignavibacteriales bacterium]